MSPRAPRSAVLGRALHRAAALSRDDWAVFAGALGLLSLVSLGLKVAGLRRTLALVDSRAEARRCCAGVDPRGAARIAWLVEIAARCCRPRPTCLTKALVVFSLLKRRGLPAEVVLGVTKVRGPLEGHAWVQLGEGAVVGDPEPVRYTTLCRIPALPPSPTTTAAPERAP